METASSDHAEGQSAVRFHVADSVSTGVDALSLDSNHQTQTSNLTTTAPSTTAISSSLTDVDEKEEERLAEIVYSHILPSEAQVLRVFCEKMSHLRTNPILRKHVHPFTLVRFLRARNGDIPKASQMFEDSMKWRIDENIDERVAKWDIELQANITHRAQIINKFWFMAPVGVCNRGLPVLISRIGRADPGGIERECGWEPFLLQHCSVAEYQVEVARQRTLATGELLLSFVAIYDMAGGNVPKWSARAWAAVDPFKRLAPILDLHYPERLARAFIVNVPWAFKMFWAMFTPIIPKATQDKLTVHRTSWLADMTTGTKPWLSRSQIPPDLLLDGASVPADIEAQVKPPAGLVT